MTRRALQSVSSRASGTPTFAGGTRFAFLPWQTWGSWSARQTTGADGTLLACEAFSTVCAPSTHGTRVALRAFRSSGANCAGAACHSFGAVFAIAAFGSAAAACAWKASGANGTFFARQALLAGKTRDALPTLRASYTCSAIQTGMTVMAGRSFGSHRARRPGRQPALDLIFDV